MSSVDHHEVVIFLFALHEFDGARVMPDFAKSDGGVALHHTVGDVALHDLILH